MPLDEMNFELKPKTFSKTEDNLINLKDMCISETCSSAAKISTKEKLKVGKRKYTHKKFRREYFVNTLFSISLINFRMTNRVMIILL